MNLIGTLALKQSSGILGLALLLAACGGESTAPPTASLPTDLPGVPTATTVPLTEPPPAEVATASGPIVFPTLTPITLQNAGGLVEVAHLEAQDVRVVAISPVGNWLASADGTDNHIAIYDMPFTFGVILLNGHQGAVNDLSWSPDGRIVASASDDGTVRLWDAGTGQETARIAVDQDGVASVAWSPDGRFIAAGNRHGTLVLYDSQSGDELLRVQPGPDFSDVSALAWSPDSQFIAAATLFGVESPSEIHVYDAATGEMSRSLTDALLPSPWSIEWASLPNQIGWIRSSDSSGVIWNLDRTPEAAVLPAPTYSLDFSPNSEMVVTGGSDHVVRVWDMLGTQLAILNGHTDMVHSVDWNIDNTFIVSAGSDGIIRAWGVPSP